MPGELVPAGVGLARAAGGGRSAPWWPGVGPAVVGLVPSGGRARPGEHRGGLVEVGGLVGYWLGCEHLAQLGREQVGQLSGEHRLGAARPVTPVGYTAQRVQNSGRGVAARPREWGQRAGAGMPGGVVCAFLRSGDPPLSRGIHRLVANAR
jgi:hypothetical protein